MTDSAILPPQYLKAVSDAADPQPEEVYSHLTPVSPSNQMLLEKTVNNEKYILVVSWVKETHYYKTSVHPFGRL